MVRDDQPDAREGQAGRRGESERFIVPMKPGNAGGGTGPQFKTNAERSEGPGDWVAAAPQVFQPVSSGWGLLGCTVMRLEVADAATVQEALAMARSNVAEIASAVDAAAISNPAEAPAIADVESGVKAELYDQLRSVIERVREQEPTASIEWKSESRKASPTSTVSSKRWRTRALANSQPSATAS